ncbi:hypothetical protein SDC9_176077 [bioreactor metagenome]|uniref:Uncharacterized protein n=1 Tax=bioreactor metagenome TaxID=1076179 RepID=A0A645GX81_9ZZZZ
MPFFFKLVIGGSGNNTAFKPWNCFVVNDGSQGARREDVALYIIDLVRTYVNSAEFFNNPLGVFGTNVGYNKFRAFILEEFAQGVTDVAQTLDGDSLAGERGGTPSLFSAGFDAFPCSVSSNW